MLLPANIYSALAGVSFAGKSATPLLIRIPEQLIYIAFALAPAWEARSAMPRTHIKQSERI